MSAEQTPDIAAVLAEHEYMLQNRAGSICTCGFVPEVDATTLQAQQDYHRTHVAQALAPVLAAAVREAEQRALREAASQMLVTATANRDRSHWRAHAWSHWLRDRADRVAVDAPEGGEGR